MAMEFRTKQVFMSGVVGVDDAERLLEWVQNKPTVKVDFSACTHIHPANIQVLLAATAVVSAWPEDADLTHWLKSAFSAV